MEKRTDFPIRRDAKPITDIANDSEQMRQAERHLRDALEDDEVFEALSRLHREPTTVTMVRRRTGDHPISDD